MENIINYVRTIDVFDKDLIFLVVAALLSRNIDLNVELKDTKIALKIS